MFEILNLPNNPKIFKYAIFSGLVLLLVLSGCEFQLNDIPEKEIELPVEELMNFTINESTELIKIGWTTEFSFKASDNTNEIILGIIKIDSVEIPCTFGGHYIRFQIDPSEHANGTHSLNIRVVTKSFSGSIADTFDAEGFVYNISIPIFFDNTLPDGDYGLTANLTEQGIELDWRSFDHFNFESYTIYRQDIPIATIYGPNDTTFLDTTYWEGQSNIYNLTINTPAGDYRSTNVSVDTPVPELEWEWQADGSILVSWNYPRFPASYKSYYVYSIYYYGNTYPEKIHVTDVNQNYCYLKYPGFCNDLRIFLKFVPHGLTGDETDLIPVMRLIESRPSNTLPYMNAYNVNDKDYMILANMEKIYRYHPDNMSISDSIVSPVAWGEVFVTNDGQRFVYYTAEEFRIHRTDDFALEYEITLPERESINNWIDVVTLSDNGLLLASGSGGISYLYDIYSGSMIRKDTLLTDGIINDALFISPDGNKIIAVLDRRYSEPVVLYSLLNGEWKEIGRSLNGGKYVYFSKGMESVYLFGPTSTEKRNAESFELEASYESSSMGFQSIDFDFGQFLCYDKIMDIKTGEILKELKVGYFQTCALYNNFLISSSGIQVNIPDKK